MTRLVTRDAKGNYPYHTKVDQSQKSLPPRADLMVQIVACIRKHAAVAGDITAAWEGLHSGVPTVKNGMFVVTSSPAITKALERHMMHIANDCISDPEGIELHYAHGDKIPTARGSVKNERLHLALEQSNKNARVGGQYLAGTHRAVVYRWNATKYAEADHGRFLWFSQPSLPLLSEAWVLHDKHFRSLHNDFKGMLIKENLPNVRRREVGFTPFDTYKCEFKEADVSTIALAAWLQGNSEPVAEIPQSATELPFVNEAADLPPDFGWRQRDDVSTTLAPTNDESVISFLFRVLAAHSPGNMVHKTLEIASPDVLRHTIFEHIKTHAAT